jgi:hypothetical protein
MVDMQDDDVDIVARDHAPLISKMIEEVVFKEGKEHGLSPTKLAEIKIMHD